MANLRADVGRVPSPGGFEPFIVRIAQPRQYTKKAVSALFKDTHGQTRRSGLLSAGRQNDIVVHFNHAFS